MHGLRPNAYRAKKLIVVFILFTAITVLQFPVLIYFYKLASDMLDNADTYDEAFENTMRMVETVIVSALGILGVILMIWFIQWFRRAYYNLRLIPGIEASFKDGWAAGAWFVPFLNFVRPYKMMKEIWMGTQQSVSHRLGSLAPPTVVGVWWGLLLAYSIFSSVTIKMGHNEDLWRGLLTRAQFDLMSYALLLPAAFTAIMMVRRIHEFENELWQESQTPSDSVFSLLPENESEIQGASDESIS